MARLFNYDVKRRKTMTLQVGRYVGWEVCRVGHHLTSCALASALCGLCIYVCTGEGHSGVEEDQWKAWAREGRNEGSRGVKYRHTYIYDKTYMSTCY